MIAANLVMPLLPSLTFMNIDPNDPLNVTVRLNQFNCAMFTTHEVLPSFLEISANRSINFNILSQITVFRSFYTMSYQHKPGNVKAKNGRSVNVDKTLNFSGFQKTQKFFTLSACAPNTDSLSLPTSTEHVNMEPSELLLNTSDATPAEINNGDVCHSGVEDTLETEAELDDQSDRQTNLGDNKALEQQKEEVASSSAVLERVVAVIKHLAECGFSFQGHDELFGSVHNGNYLQSWTKLLIKPVENLWIFVQ